MGDIWQSGVTSHFETMFIEKYDECMNDMNNVDKCKITNICKISMYMYSEKKKLIRGLILTSGWKRHHLYENVLRLMSIQIYIINHLLLNFF